MENEYLISVIMSTYNEREDWLRSSIESILNQTWKNIEFVIVNDNPNNLTIRHILSEYVGRDKRIRLVQNKTNLGLACSMNLAWKEARGKYIARMDADDISMEKRLEGEMNYLLNNNLDMVASNRICISEQGEIIGSLGIIPSGIGVEKLLPYGDMIVHPSVLMKREVLIKLDGYRELVPVEDYDLWLRMLTASYRIGILNEPLIQYRIRENGISMTNRYRQFIMNKYAKRLFKERKKYGGKDSFSEENKNRYLSSKENLRKKEHFAKAMKCFDEGVQSWKCGKKSRGVGLMLRAISSDSSVAEKMFYILLYKIKRQRFL